MLCTALTSGSKQSLRAAPCATINGQATAPCGTWMHGKQPPHWMCLEHLLPMMQWMWQMVTVWNVAVANHKAASFGQRGRTFVLYACCRLSLKVQVLGMHAAAIVFLVIKRYHNPCATINGACMGLKWQVQLPLEAGTVMAPTPLYFSNASPVDHPQAHGGFTTACTTPKRVMTSHSARLSQEQKFRSV